MIRLLHCFFASLLLCGGASASDANKSFYADLIASGQSVECNLDSLRLGKSLDFEVTIVNKIGRVLELDTAKPSCGCTVAKIDGKKTVDEQKSFVVQLSIRIDEHGDFEKPVLFYEKDQISPLFVLKILGESSDPIRWLLPGIVDLDPKTLQAEVSMELKAAFDDVRLDFEKIAIIGNDFRGFVEKSMDSSSLKAKLKFQGNADSPVESCHLLKVAFKDKDGSYVRDYPIVVRKLPPLRSSHKALSLLRLPENMSLVRLALIGVFEKHKEMSVFIHFKNELIGTFETTPMSDRIVAVRFFISEESSVWKVSSGTFKFSVGNESVEVPFVFEE